MITLKYGEKYFKEKGKWYKQIVKEVTNIRDIKTLELHLEENKLIGLCGWCGCRSTIKIKYCPLCRKKVGRRKMTGTQKKKWKKFEKRMKSIRRSIRKRKARTEKYSIEELLNE